MPARDAAMLVLLCLALYLPGLAAIPPLDRDEARFAQASRQMVETGDYIDIRFQETARHKKPAGAYWAQAASARLVAGDGPAPIWAYRIPSVLGAIAAVLLTRALAGLWLPARAATLAAALLASSVLLTAEAHMAKTDALLLATVVAAQLGLARAHAGRRGPGVWLPFWLGIGCGILVKGPVAPMVVGLAAAALWLAERRAGRGAAWLRALEPLKGAPVALAVALPWFVAVQLRTGGAFLESAVGGDMLPKLMGGVESHGAPPGYYALLAFATFWPGSLLLWPALAGAWRARAEPAVLFALCWLLPAWLVFEAAPTKLPHYVLPMYPALAILAAAWLARFEGFPALPRGTRGFALFWIALSAALAAAVAALAAAGVEPGAAPADLATLEGAARRLGSAFEAAPAAFLAAPAALAAGIAGGLALRRGRPMAAALRAAALGGLFLVLLGQSTLPSLANIFVAPRVVAAARALDPAAGPLAAAGFHEPSLVFLAGTGTRLVAPEGAARLLAERPGALAAVEKRGAAAFAAEAARLGLAVETRATVSGLNYSNGRAVEIDLVARRDRP